MINRQQEYYAEDREPREEQHQIDRNERITVIAGALLFVFIIVELFITSSVRSLGTEHVFVGILLSGPLVVKMLSTGYRFFRYYTKSPKYVRQGPPNSVLRILAPFLVLTTLLVFTSGYLMVFGHNFNFYLKIHAVSCALWLPLLIIHIYAYIRKVLSVVSSNRNTSTKRPTSNKKAGLGINIAGLIIGVIASIALLPKYGRGWGHFILNIPSPLSLGIVLAIFGLAIAAPLIRFTRRREKQVN